MKKNITIPIILIPLMILAIIMACRSEDNPTKFSPPTPPDLSHSNDAFLYNNDGKSLYERYGLSVIWRWDDDFIRPSQRATPVDESLVIDIGKMIEYLWIGSFTAQGEAGEKFIQEHIPVEVVLIGSYIFNDDGTRLLGYAEAGVRISLLRMNELNFLNQNWMLDPGGGVIPTMNHEFSHIVHQKNGIPTGFNSISENYLGSSWSNNVSLSDAIKLGMVRNYGTLNEYEDFCEIISHYLAIDEETFNLIFIDQDDCTAYTTANEIVNCNELNEGREKIALKLDLVKKFFSDNFDINLTSVRDTLLHRVEKVINLNDIPES